MIRVISGTAKKTKLIVPEGQTRAVTDRIKTVVFDLLQEHIAGARVLDLYAGSGAYGIEALSRGAQSCSFIDSDEEAVRAIQQNLQATKLAGQGKVIKGKLPGALQQLTSKEFDLVFCDPPYTQIATFELKNFSAIITPENVFCLRVPHNWRARDEQLQSFEVIYAKQVGVSELIFLRSRARG